MQCLTCQAEFEGTIKFCPRCGSRFEQPTSEPQPATEATVDPFLGQTLGGRYKIVRLLGEGGMGAVYLGEQPIGGTSRKVAVKTLHQHLSKDPKIKARFTRECETVAQLQHPNTIQLYDYGTTDDGTLYMVMEYVQGRSLASLLEEKHALEPARTEHILQQICDALTEAHALGIVHRDLKPDNIVLTERAKDWVKLLDFGIAKRSEDGAREEQKLTQQGTVLGTPPYMSPEQFTGKPIDLRSDLYSIGVMAYEMLAGRLPFNANTPWEWATQHMTVPPLMLTVTFSGQSVSDAMRNAVMRLLEKDPTNRFGSAREFFEAFASGGVGASAPARDSGGMSLAAQKGKTEIGTPIEIPAVGYAPGGVYGAPPPPYGTPGAALPASPGPGVPSPAYGFQTPAQPQYTPAAGNVAFPTPMGMPQAPGPQRGGGRRALIVALLVLLLIPCGAAIYFGMRPDSAAGAGGGLDPGDAAPPPQITVATATVEPTTPVTLDTSIAPLTGTKPALAAHPDAGVAKPATPAQPPHPPPPPSVNDPPACVRARIMQRRGAAPGQDEEQGRAAFMRYLTECRQQGGHL